VLKNANEISDQLERLGLIPGVEVHLAATGLCPWKFDFAAQSLEQLDHRNSGLWVERVGQASDEQIDFHVRGS
jgi:hypothetical protein